MTLTAEQKKRRALGIGGSEVAAICGLHPYAKPIDVYEAKVEGRELEDNHHMERGRFFERPTAEWYVHRYGGVLKELDTVQSRKHPLVIVHPDFLVAASDVDFGQNATDLSIKVPGPRTWHQWGEAETDECPTYALVQLQYELIPLGELFGVNRGVVAAPIEDDLRRYPMFADFELQAMLVDAVDRFWRDHVLPRRAPAPDASQSYSDYLSRKFPNARGQLLAAGPADEAMFARYWNARTEKERFEAEEKEARQHLESRIGEAKGLDGEGWRVTWNDVKGRARTDWEAICREAGVPEPLVQKHTTIGAGYRRFLPTLKKESK